jgi:hypothetical protein
MIVIFSSIVPPIYHKRDVDNLAITFYSPDKIHNFLQHNKWIKSRFTEKAPQALSGKRQVHNQDGVSPIFVSSRFVRNHYKVVTYFSCTHPMA